MDEVAWVSELDRRGAADAVVEARARLLRVEADRLLLATHWADLHAEESVLADGEGGRRVLPGSERFVLVGGDGTPEVGEFAAAELALYMQVSLAAAASFMADGLDLRHRLPLLWAAVQEGSVEAWRARKIAARIRSTGLNREQAAWVDTQVAPYVATLPWSRCWDLLEAKVIAADPQAAEQRRLAAELERFVRTGRSSEHGLTTIVAKAAAGDAIFFVAMCDRLAQILELEGDLDPVNVRRSKAIGILADPARALAMLQRHATIDADSHGVDGAPPSPDPDHLPEQDALPADGSGTFGEAPVVQSPYSNVPALPAPLAETAEAGTASDASPIVASRPSFGTCCTACGAVATDPTVILRPLTVDPAKLRPAATLYIHTSRDAWDQSCGVARVEGVGPVTLAQAIDMLAHANVTVREVIDTDADVPVDAYEVPDRMREQLVLRNPATAFPWGPVASRSHDADHTVPYLSPDKGGPPGQTRIGNLGLLPRRAHRVKTHASGWRHRQPTPGVHEWRTPADYWFRVDEHGSHALGRDPANATQLTAAEQHLLELLRAA